MAELMKEWTVMFYFAGDNDLAPFMIPQLRAIKNAPWHQEANVIVRFDSNVPGTPTKFYDIHKKRKNNAPDRRYNPGNSEDAFIKDLEEDELKTTDGIPPEASENENKPGNSPTKPNTGKALNSLSNFLEFGHNKYRAKHYLLFLVGHGMIVANDHFLSDDNPKSAVSLKELGRVLSAFADKAKGAGSALEFVGLHSCSMSSIEAAYELKGAAKYMMASQGPSFVGSWPYQSILIKLLHELSEQKLTTDKQIAELFVNFHDYCKYSSMDYKSAGYSFEVTLCNLTKVDDALKVSLKGLFAALLKAVENPLGQNLILLAHWKAQSFWQESYTDLYDFCLCLRRACDGFPDIDWVKELREKCAMIVGEKEEKGKLAPGDNQLIVRSVNYGVHYQYAHGLSIYFPWSEPFDKAVLGDKKNAIDSRYGQYAFNDKQIFEDESWHAFLTKYLKLTMRATRREEDTGTNLQNNKDKVLLTVESAPNIVGFQPLGTMGTDPPKTPGTGGNDPNKTGGTSGDYCVCPSIKNYSMIEVVSPVNPKRKRKTLFFSASEELLPDSLPSEQPPEQ